MTSVAVVIGSADYTRLSPLPCCRKDVDAVVALVEGTGRFDAIHRLLDLEAADLKRELRAALEPVKEANEVFFYFSGHGHSEDGEFYFCPRDFDHRRPNETGLSNGELTALLRESSPELAVKVVDACSSGALLIKSGSQFLPAEKGGLKNLVQIASCLDSQTSLAGDPLSEFTERFCQAAIRKTEGPVYYTDVIAVLRDEYLNDRERTPHFVFQASARETFMEDAAALEAFRTRFAATWASSSAIDDAAMAEHVPALVEAEPPSLLELLTETDAKLARPEDIASTVSALFDGLKAKLEGGAFPDFFDLATIEHSDFEEQGARAFIIRVLTQEKRADNFVTASITRERKKANRYGSWAATLALGLYGDDDIVEHWDLTLNMRMERAQLRITLTPKFLTLQRIVLVVTCAPSLEHCYVFELATRHPRTDFNAYAEEGIEVTRRWYTQRWRDDVGWLVDKIAEKLDETVKEHLAATQERLGKI